MTSFPNVQDPSLKGLWRISWPIMLSFLSSSSMIFFNRIFLASYSTEAVLGVASAGNIAFAFIFMVATLASMAEVFVARANGEENFKSLGAITWQTLWLSLLSFLFFIPLSLYGGELLVALDMIGATELPFFQKMVLFGPAFVFQFGINAFFIGQGRSWLISWVAIISNIINILLDVLLIFGVKGLLPAMGLTGSAYATGLATIIGGAITLIFFLTAKERSLRGTGSWRLSPKLLVSVILLGAAPAIFILYEYLAWGCFYRILNHATPLHLMTATISQTLVLSLFFFAWGLEKGTAAIAGNLIGAKKQELIPELLRSAKKLNILFSLGLFLLLIPLHKPLISIMAGDLSKWGDGAIYFTFVLFVSVIYLFFENARFAISGVLAAMGDTFFLMVSGTLCLSFLLLLPTYLLAERLSPAELYSILIFYSIGLPLILNKRIKKNKLKSLNTL